MFFSTPLAFAGFAAAAVLAAAYFFRTKFKSREVSSLLFWGTASQENGQGKKLRRIRTPLVFYLELLIISLIVIAAATPLYRTETPVPPVVVFDTSASMGALGENGKRVADNAASALRGEAAKLGTDKIRLFTAAEDGLKNYGTVDAGAVTDKIGRGGFGGAGGDLPAAAARANSISGGAAIFVVTDTPPPDGYQVPRNVRWLAAGGSGENAAISFACRSISSDGDRLLAEIRVFPPREKTLALTIEGIKGEGRRETTVRTGHSGTARLSELLPEGTSDILLELVEADALAEDNSAKLASPYSGKVPVVIDISDEKLRKITAAAVNAAGLAAYVTNRLESVGNSARAVVFADAVPNGVADTKIVFSRPDGQNLVSGSFFALPSERLFEGVDFTGITWNAGTNSLPGDGILFCSDLPVITSEEKSAGRIVRISADSAADQFFRTAAFPELVWNILSGASERSPEKGRTEWRFPAEESDLGRCGNERAGDLTGLITSAGTAGKAAVWFGLAALALLAAHHLRWRGARTLRFSAYGLLAAALFSPAVKIRSAGGAVVVAADRSTSIPAGELEAQRGMVASLYGRRPDGARTAVVAFGADSTVEDISKEGAFQGFSTEIDGDASDIAGALSTALDLFEANEAGRIVILSDGLNTGGRSLEKAAEEAARRNIAIDYRIQPRPDGGDLAVVDVDAPLKVGKDEAVMATASVAADFDCEAIISFMRGGTVLYRGRRNLPKGTTRFYFRDANVPEGMNLYAVKVESASGELDAIPENNTAKFAVTSGTSRPVLVVPASEESSLPGLLASGGADIVTCGPDGLGWTPAELARFSGLVIENRRADDFGQHALKSIASWVRHAGGALVMTGGRNAFGLGGYRKSPLEEILPVSMELKSEERKHSVAVAIVLDRSGSMAARCAPSLTKMDLANIATAETVDTLRNDDGAAVIAVDSEPHVVIPMGSVAEVKKQRAKILRIESMGGGIYIYNGLKAGIQELLKSNAGIRHLILFADASDSEEPGVYDELIVSAREVGITVSVVGLGAATDCDAELLRDIAELGGGTCTFSSDPMEIPRLFAQDTIIMSRMALETNPVAVAFTASLPQYSDSLRRDAPPIHGYNLCYSKPDATVMAVSDDENRAPILATRPAGAGRALVFTGEADGELSGPFAKWDGIAEFYAAMARFCTDESDGSEGIFLRQRRHPGGIEITAYVDASDPALLAVEELDVVLLSSGEKGRKSTTGKLKWNGADSLSAIFPVDASEIVLPVVTLPSGKVVRMPPVCNPYSPEFLPDERGAGERNLRMLAEKTGGKRLITPADVWNQLPEVKKDFDLSPALYLLAALVFVTEVILRRLGVDADRILAAWKKAEAPAADAESAVARDAAPEFAQAATKARVKKRAKTFPGKSGREQSAQVPSGDVSPPLGKENSGEEPAGKAGIFGEASRRAGARLHR